MNGGDREGNDNAISDDIEDGLGNSNVVQAKSTLRGTEEGVAWSGKQDGESDGVADQNNSSGDDTGPEDLVGADAPVKNEN